MPKILGHRGASAHALENTLAAFRRARDDGADGVELDVIRCATGEIVVFHDDDLRRLGDGRRDDVRSLRFAELRALQLRDPKTGFTGTIPTLDEVLEELGPHLLVNVELKASRAHHGQRLAPAVATLLYRHRAARVIVSSFNPLALLRFRLAAPDLPTGLLFHGEQSRPLRAAWPRFAIRPTALHPEHTLVQPDTVARWRGEGLAINTWTVDDPAELVRLRDLGVDAIIANDPLAARRALVGPP